MNVTFKNYDGAILSTTTVNFGETPSYEGETPTKDEANNEGTITRYTFKGWDKTLRGIQADTTFIAQYEESTYYVCKFLDWDSTLLKEVVIKKTGG